MIGLFNSLANVSKKVKSHIEKYWNEWFVNWESESTNWDNAQ
jgi:hypothetical protein|tara:strand:+ start:623 stop:748 length:126 start_codon:yes stop_codon:yes gene_type:complete